MSHNTTAHNTSTSIPVTNATGENVAPLTPDTLLTSAELAKALKVAPRTPEAWRNRGDGPRYHRIGGKLGRVIYRWGDVLDYLNRRAFNSTSEESALAV